MGSCNIDHTVEDTRKKLEGQKDYLPGKLYAESNSFLNESPSQEELNELFHLLKKYDLSSVKEQEERNSKIKELVDS
ncbi:group-specific protein [Halobacillus andaensis]|nr:group-specific protein [Halobacillus andaensis]MBP2003789.1 hypothetical protein [Halobacillus andaensis]